MNVKYQEEESEAFTVGVDVIRLGRSGAKVIALAVRRFGMGRRRGRIGVWLLGSTHVFLWPGPVNDKVAKAVQSPKPKFRNSCRRLLAARVGCSGS